MKRKVLQRLLTVLCISALSFSTLTACTDDEADSSSSYDSDSSYSSDDSDESDSTYDP